MTPWEIEPITPFFRPDWLMAAKVRPVGRLDFLDVTRHHPEDRLDAVTHQVPGRHGELAGFHVCLEHGGGAMSLVPALAHFLLRARVQ